MKRYNFKEFKEKSEKIHKDESGQPLYIYPEQEYTNRRTDMIIYCCKHDYYFLLTPAEHYRGRGCSKCGIEKSHNKLKDTFDIFKKKANKKHFNQYNYPEQIYTNNKQEVIITCKLHGEFKQLAYLHLKGCGCQKCGFEKMVRNQNTLTIDDFIKRSKLIHGDKYDYQQSTYINIYTKIKIYCKECDEFFTQIPYVHLNGHGHEKCSKRTSKGENKIMKILNENKIEFIHQYKYKDCRNINILSFDFYLPKYNCCIEYDGRFHFESVDYFGGDEKLKYTQKNDNIKNSYCEYNNINLIRIHHKIKDVEHFLIRKLKILSLK